MSDKSIKIEVAGADKIYSLEALGVRGGGSGASGEMPNYVYVSLDGEHKLGNLKYEPVMTLKPENFVIDENAGMFIYTGSKFDWFMDQDSIGFDLALYYDDVELHYIHFGTLDGDHIEYICGAVYDDTNYRYLYCDWCCIYLEQDDMQFGISADIPIEMLVELTIYRVDKTIFNSEIKLLDISEIEAELSDVLEEVCNL